MKIKNIKSILFDFDGTIADTIQKGILIYNQIALKHHYKQINEQNLSEFRNKKILEILKQLQIPVRRLPFLANKIRKEMQSDLHDIPVCKGIPGVLKELKSMGYELGILSTNNLKNIKLFLSSHHLPYFDFLFASKELFGKHRLIKKAMKKNNLCEDEILYIGDEIRDIEACKKIGITIISVCWGYNDKSILARENPGFIAETPADILEFLQ
jgi:phosphoglycolate phosphatase